MKTTLDKKMTERFMVVKEHTGMKDDKNVLAFLISKEYDKIQDTLYHRIFVANETYIMAEKEADAQGVTVDIYVTELVEKKLKEAERGAKHGN